MFKLILQLHAHKKGTGSSHNGRDSNSQRLGTKAHDGKVVTAGSIIVRQHGTRFHVGKNVGMGRDYTIYAKIAGVVYAKIAGVVRFGRHGRTERIISVEPLEAKEA